MNDGTFGLFNADDDSIYFNVRNGDNGIPLEDILPEHMCGAGFAGAPISAYINAMYMWLCSASRWQAAQDAIQPQLIASKGKAVKFQPPSLDFSDLKLLSKEGQVDYIRLRDLCLIVAPYWDQEPETGLITSLIGEGLDLPDIRNGLMQTIPRHGTGKSTSEMLVDLYARPDIRFGNLFMPPEHRDDKTNIDLDVDGCLKFAFKWIRSNEDISRAAWHVDMRKLGVLRIGEDIDFKRTEMISNHIWSQRHEVPSFANLLSWLNARDQKEQEAIQTRLNIAKKKKKLERKQSKLRRKRGR